MSRLGVGRPASEISQQEEVALGAADQGYWRRAWQRLRRDWLAVASAGVFVLICLMAIGAPLVSAWVTHYEPQQIDLDTNYGPPSAQHWFGTDEYGRDYFTRTVWAARISLTVGVGAALVALLIGVTLGLVAGFFGGAIDDTINGAVNVFLCLPGFFLLILLATLIPMNAVTLAFVIGVLAWTGAARQVRGVVLAVRQLAYVEAASALGVGSGRILWRHVLPNVSSIVIVTTGFEVAGGILAESGLSFLSLGARAPDASWGNMLINSVSYINKAPWLVVYPGLAIFVTVLCIFLFADGLRDALDPRLVQQ